MSVTFTIDNNRSYVDTNCPETITTTVYPADKYYDEWISKEYPFELNMSNSNAFAVLSALGIEEDYCGQVSAEEFYNRVRTLFNPKNITTGDSHSKEPNKCEVFSCGRTLEQTTRYKWALMQIATEAKKRNQLIVWS
jgi:hypothetical protein